jgi:tetratricopeptide (TPR) repeat protein
MEDLMTKLDETIRHIACTLLITGALISCAVSGDKADVTSAADLQQGQQVKEVREASFPKQQLTDDLMFDILLGEIAGQRGQVDVAVPHYLQAAEDAEDPRVAERAVQIASYAKQYEVAQRAAHRWVELDGENIEARKALTALALHTGDTDEVATQMDYMLSVSEDPEEGYQLATAILARTEDKQSALAAMETLVAHHPDSPYAWMALGRIAILAGQAEQALTAVNRALEQHPDLPEALILKAQLLVRLDRKEEATQLLKRAIEVHPDDASLHFAYGRMLLDAEELDAAREQFARVVKLEPDNPDGLYSLALLELETGKFRAGEKHLKQLLEQGQREQSAYYYLGYATYERGDNDAALKWYGMVESGDYWGQAQLRAAAIMVEQERIDDMRDYMRVMRQKNPEKNAQLYLVEGQALSSGGFTAEAYTVYGTALDANPDNEDLLYARALVAEKLGHLDVAESDMRRILASDPDNVRTLNALGYTLADQTDRYEEALEYISKAYEQSPDDPAIIDSMGWVHFRMGKLDMARLYLQQAWDMTRDSEIGAHLGEVMWAQGDHDAAREIWKVSLEAKPDNAVLLEVLDRINP